MTGAGKQHEGLAGRVVVVTGGGRGIGREHCLAFAAAGATVVVNDLGVGPRGEGSDPGPARAVAAEIEAAGGTAFASWDDAADVDAAERLVRDTVDRFGAVHALVNNAGVVHDAMFVNMSPADWDGVLHHTLRSHYAMTRPLAAYWRERHKAGEELRPRVVSTTSGAGLFGSVGQANYAAAKAAVCAATIVEAAELRRYGVLVNAVAPVARTRLTERLFADTMTVPDGGFDAMHPANISPAVLWLASASNTSVSGRVFELEGGSITVCMNWHRGPADDAGERRTVDSAGHALTALAAKAPDLVGVYN